MTISITFMDGFDQYSVGLPSNANQNGWYSEVNVTSPPARTGTKSIAAYGGAGPRRLIASTNAIGLGFAFLVSSYNPTTAYDFAGLYGESSSSRVLTVGVNTSGRLTINRGGTVYTSADSVNLAVSTWRHLELQLIVSATVGEIKAWVDGVLVINQVNINTGTTSIDTILLGWGGLNNAPYATYYDDFFMYNFTSGDSNVGDKSVLVLYPNSNTGVADFAAVGSANAWDCLNDAASDGDSTYISTASSTATSVFDLDNLPSQYTTINAVQTNAVSRKTDAGPCTVRIGIVQGANTINGTSFNNSTSYVFGPNDVFMFDPLSGVGFTKSDVDSLKIKVERTA